MLAIWFCTINMLLHRVHILCILIFLSPDHQYSHLLNPFLLWIRIYLTELAVYETLILIHFSAYFYLEHFFLKLLIIMQVYTMHFCTSDSMGFTNIFEIQNKVRIQTILHVYNTYWCWPQHYKQTTELEVYTSTDIGDGQVCSWSRTGVWQSKGRLDCQWGNMNVTKDMFRFHI